MQKTSTLVVCTIVIIKNCRDKFYRSTCSAITQ